MARYAALIGSINVGGNRVTMADLKAALGNAGLRNVETVTASGNVLFDADERDAARETIERVLRDAFGIDTVAVVRSKAELEAALAENPFDGVGEDRFVHVHFLAGQPDHAAFAAVERDNPGAEKLAAGTGALHIDFVGGVADSKLTRGFLEKRLGFKGTARNVRSLRRIMGKFD